MVDEVEVNGIKIKLPYRYEIEIEGRHLIYREYFKKDEKLRVDLTVSLVKRLLDIEKKQGRVEDYKVSAEEGDEVLLSLDIEYSDDRHLYDYLITEFLPRSEIGEMTLTDIIVRRSLLFGLPYLLGGEQDGR